MRSFFTCLWNRIKRRRVALIILIIFWVVFISVNDPIKYNPVAERIYGGTWDGGVTVTTGNTYSQGLPCTINGLCEIKLKFRNSYTVEKTSTESTDPDNEEATSKDTIKTLEDNYSTIKLELLDGETQDVLKTQTVYGNKITDGEYYTWQFTPIEQSANMNYIIRLTGTGENNDEYTGIKILTHSDPSVHEGKSGINGSPLTEAWTLTAGFQNSKTTLLYSLMWILLILISFIATLAIGNSLGKNFLIIGIAIGMLYLIYNPFPHAVDESTHFFRSFQISEGNFEDQINSEGAIGGQVPENYPTDEMKFSVFSWYANRDYFDEPFSSQTVFSVNPYMSSVNPVDHAVSAIGITLGRSLNLSIAWIIILSRFFDLLFYIVFCYLAIRKARYYRTIFFGASVLPLCLFLAGSCSQDAVLISASIYFVSSWAILYFADADAPAIGIKQLLPMLLMVPFMASVKYLIYIPIFLLVLLIPKKRFKNKNKLVFCVITVALCALFMVYQLHLLNTFPFTEDRNGDVNVGQQINFIFHNIYFSYKNFVTYFAKSILSKLETMSFIANFLSKLAAVLVVIGSICIKDKYQWKNKKQQRTFVITTVLITVVIYLLVIAALYVGYTPVGQWNVEGVQTRYILPFIPLICMALSCIPVTNDIKNYEFKLSFGMLVINAAIVSQCCLLVSS